MDNAFGRGASSKIDGGEGSCADVPPGLFLAVASGGGREIVKQVLSPRVASQQVPCSKYPRFPSFDGPEILFLRNSSLPGQEFVVIIIVSFFAASFEEFGSDPNAHKVEVEVEVSAVRRSEEIYMEIIVQGMVFFSGHY